MIYGQGSVQLKSTSATRRPRFVQRAICDDITFIELQIEIARGCVNSQPFLGHKKMSSFSEKLQHNRTILSTNIPSVFGQSQNVRLLLRIDNKELCTYYSARVCTQRQWVIRTNSTTHEVCRTTLLLLFSSLRCSRAFSVCRLHGSPSKTLVPHRRQ
jgi:hypothetical protein